MNRGLWQTLSLTLVITALVAGGVACKTVQPSPETPANAAPAFDSSAKQAEKVDESSGFREANPTAESFGETPSSAADKLNAQGILKPIYFDFDRADVRQDAQQVLTSNAGRIRES